MIEHIVDQLVKLRAKIQRKRSQGEDVGVDNFLFVGSPGTGEFECVMYCCCESAFETVVLL